MLCYILNYILLNFGTQVMLLLLPLGLYRNDFLLGGGGVGWGGVDAYYIFGLSGWALIRGWALIN